MDRTWKVCVQRQITANPLISDNMRDACLWIVNHSSENECRALAYSKDEQGRFFYKRGSGNNLAKDKSAMRVLRNVLKNKIYTRRQLNSFMRQFPDFVKALRDLGLDSDVQFLGEAVTYRKSGHKYVNGVRIY